MQVKLKQLFGFSTLFEEIKNEKLPLRTAYKLSQLNREIQVQEQFYREKLNEIISRYGEYSEDGNPILTPDGRGVCLRPGTEAQCHAEVEELDEFEVTLSNFTFSFEDFPGIELTITQMELLFPFFKE